jgi:hypothetical protein
MNLFAVVGPFDFHRGDEVALSFRWKLLSGCGNSFPFGVLDGRNDADGALRVFPSGHNILNGWAFRVFRLH